MLLWETRDRVSVHARFVGLMICAAREFVSHAAVEWCAAGWDLSNIEPQGFPQVNLGHCHQLSKLDFLSDPDMVRSRSIRM